MRNIYSVPRAFFRDAGIDSLVDRSPVDKDPDWRNTAIFTRDRNGFSWP